jgi:hypothetical protein
MAQLVVGFLSLIYLSTEVGNSNFVMVAAFIEFVELSVKQFNIPLRPYLFILHLSDIFDQFAVLLTD